MRRRAILLSAGVFLLLLLLAALVVQRARAPETQLEPPISPVVNTPAKPGASPAAAIRAPLPPPELDDLQQMLDITRPHVEFLAIVRCPLEAPDNSVGRIGGSPMFFEDGHTRFIVFAPSGSGDAVIEGLGTYTISWSNVKDMGEGTCTVGDHAPVRIVVMGRLLDSRGRGIADADLLGCGAVDGETGDDGSFVFEPRSQAACTVNASWSRPRAAIFAEDIPFAPTVVGEQIRDLHAIVDWLVVVPPGDDTPVELEVGPDCLSPRTAAAAQRLGLEEGVCIGHIGGRDLRGLDDIGLAEAALAITEGATAGP